MSSYAIFLTTSGQKMACRVMVGALLGLVVMAANIPIARAEERYLTALEVSGNVTMSSVDGGASSAAIKPSDQIGLQSKIVVGQGGSCRLSVDAAGERRIWVRENSSIAYLAGADGSGRIRVLSGSLLANVKGLTPSEEFAVESPLAIASVRGSGFLVSAEGHFGSFEHTLYILAHSGEQYVLTEGNSVDVTTDGHFLAPQPLSEDEKALWSGWATTGHATKTDNESAADDSGSASIMDARESYYMSANCQTVSECDGADKSSDPADALINGKKGKKGKEGKKQQTQSPRLQDLQMMIGDEAKFPLRVQLPKNDSQVRIQLGPNTQVELSGVMMACLERGGPGDPLKAKIFQAGRYSAQVEYEDGKTVIKIISGNTRHLTSSKVKVGEGSVRHSAPDLCRSCFSESETIVSAGECLESDMKVEDDWDKFDDELPSDGDSSELNLPYR